MRQFRERGFIVSDTIGEGADVCVINTCSVTGKADRECRQIVRRARRRSPGAYIVVVGCYAQLAPEEIASIDGVDLVLGASEKFSIFEHASPGFIKESVPKIRTEPIDEASGFGPAWSFDADNRTRAFLKIQDGCDYTCSFCTIPLARGSSRSQSPDDSVGQARALVDAGYREIVLTGVNVGDYGRKNGTSLLELLRRMTRIEGLRRIRISSIEPNLLTGELLDYWTSSEVLMPHFHIPLQSGSNEILRMMRRRYTVEDYRSLVERIRERRPDAGVGVDVIVGFPGETDVLFEDSYRFLAGLPASYFHVFTYSERVNTPAAEYGGRIDPAERTRRTNMLRILSEKKRRQFYESFVGREVEVLFEESVKNGYIRGLSPQYIRVAAPYTDGIGNSEARVRIETINGGAAVGTIIGERRTGVQPGERSTIESMEI
jgi:threonylcarbamoyladenosine tRNA methylthiotransferase MtaB